MDLNVAALIAGLAAIGGVIGHGVVGGAWLSAQLRAAEQPTTEISQRLFGPRDVVSSVFHLTWHVVTAFFLLSAGALFLTAFGALESRDLLRFLTVVYAAIVVLGLTFADKSPAAILQPLPIAFSVFMVTAGTLAWVSSNSV